MKERPIIFSANMVRAILDGSKTQTRRVLKHQPFRIDGPNYDGIWSFTVDPVTTYFGCPYGQPGDRLWVRETHYIEPGAKEAIGRGESRYDWVDYRADGEMGGEFNWRSPIHMRRWAGRITLEIEDIRVQRVQEISAEDACSEGAAEILDRPCGDPLREIAYDRGEWIADASEPDGGQMYAGSIEAFSALWDSINAKRGHGWETNPWVWAITFKKL